MHKYLIIGGTGFIGSHLTKLLMAEKDASIDIVSRSSIKENFWLKDDRSFKRVQHHCCDLYDHQQLMTYLSQIKPDTVVFAAGENPSNIRKDDDLFIHNNILNFYQFLNNCLRYYQSLSKAKQHHFKLLNISTYEIFNYPESTNNNKLIQPKTLYSASKASGFHLANAWYKTYGLPIIHAICANNYGKNQSDDKLIPMTVNNLQHNKPIQLFNNGQCQRNWIHVEDTAKALLLLAKKGVIGHTYPIGSDDFVTNKHVVNFIIEAYAKITNTPLQTLQSLITIHTSAQQKAYSHQCDYAKMQGELNWQPQFSLTNSLKKTINWYIKQK